MQLEEVKALLAQFDQSTLTEFDLREGSFELYMNKNKTAVKNISENQPTTVATFNEAVVETVPVTVVNETVEPLQATQPTAVTPENAEEITSPIVGIVYLKPAPEQEAFIKVGDSVKKGDVICIIEAMKLMNEITATVDGVVTEVLVENEDVVEFNQPLFRVAKGV